MANVAGTAILNFRIGPSLSNQIGMSDSNSNLEASQVPRTEMHFLPFPAVNYIQYK